MPFTLEETPPLQSVDSTIANEYYLRGFLGARGYEPEEVKALGAVAFGLLYRSSIEGDTITNADIDYLLAQKGEE